jgi:hypothetical protein
LPKNIFNADDDIDTKILKLRNEIKRLSIGEFEKASTYVS